METYRNTITERLILATIPARKFFGMQNNPPSNFDHVEAAFFTKLRLANHTFKTTVSNRLTNFNNLIIACLPTSGSKYQILDVAISSGVTTVDFAEQLNAKNINFAMIATDLYLDAKILSYTNWYHVLVDHNGFSLQYEIAGVGIRNWLSPRDYIKGFFLLVWFARALHVVFKCFTQPKKLQDEKLISARLKAGKFPIDLRRDNIFEKNSEFAEKFDLIRAANILNLSYFSDITLRNAVANLASRLKTGGILAICRTHQDGSNHGSVFIKSEDGNLTEQDAIGSGSEVTHLINVKTT